MDPHELRHHAAIMRRAADRFTLLRLRLANTIADAAGSQDPCVRRIGEEIHEHWVTREFPELGRLAGKLRAGAKHLDDAALSNERRAGRRLGGYDGAGFLGRGNAAHEHVWEVVDDIGASQMAATQHGANIGGFPLAPASGAPGGGLLAHPSHTLGTETPAYEDDEDDASGREA